MLYKEYDPQVLKKLQRAEIEILKDFDALCSRHGIEYFVCGGTSLGGVRHGGFIPWDDDIDLGMTREHYDKFLQVAEKEYGDKYKMINPEIDPDFPVMITKWYRTGTVFRNQETVDLGLHIGIAIDLFCFDRVPDDVAGLRKQAACAWTWGKLMILRKISNPSLYAEGWKARMMLLASRIISGGLRLLHISPQFLYRRASKAVLKYKDAKTKRVAYLFDPTPFTSVVNLDDIYPTVRRKFEDIELSYPKHVEKYLERRYGQHYMELPPESQRHNHAPEELDFGKEFPEL